MTNAERMTVIETRLRDAFHPNELQVIDDSHKHVGHAGAKDGAGHFTVVISAENFDKHSKIDIHREIYRVLDDLIPKEIHALQIKINSVF